MHLALFFQKCLTIFYTSLSLCITRNGRPCVTGKLPGVLKFLSPELNFLHLPTSSFLSLSLFFLFLLFRIYPRENLP